MLLAYSLSASGTLTTETIAALRRLERQAAAEALQGAFASLGLRWDGVAEGEVDGVFVRGYARANSRPRAIALIDGLRRLSREFPGIAVLLSGWGDLPPTTLRAGAFEMFEAAYDRAIAEALRPENRYRCS